MQLARLGLAATSLAGIDNPGLGLLERTRIGLGLDRFRVDSGAGRQGRADAVLEGGRYLSERIYLSARQGTRAGDTQGILRMELSPQIRLETDVGAHGGARAGAAFELEYSLGFAGSDSGGMIKMRRSVVDLPTTTEVLLDA
ncbi:translocation/assembly module TamB domain-containing protein [Halochromatium sp.]